MPLPTLNTVHVNRPLTNISNAYIADQTQWVADQIFPVVPVQKQSDLFFKYTKGDWFRNNAQERAPGTESAGGGYPLTTDSYSAVVYAVHKDVDPQIRANSDDPLNADRDATLWATQQLLIKREITVVQAAIKTSTWTGSTTGSDISVGTKWDAANSTPLEDIEAQVWAIYSTTGRFPNRFFIGTAVWQALKNHAEVLDRIKYTQRGLVTTDIIASLIAPPGVNDFKVIVAASIYNNAAAGASDSFTYVAPADDCLLLYATQNPGIMVPSAGYIFTWVGYAGAGSFGARLQNIPMPWLGVGTERIEGELAFATKTIGLDLGAYFADAV